ncbi:hypothetical protein BDV98DRAFT_173371 [Pterulicium gracile]|uniref:F-box domain-containing protein n=1 Tax=Pterulicium gracile TaxID=1884261 RepID=A0A5C3QBZ5_9AGAR|nr:hypothetical protein BDV98DRAFT_173371 [Pterula gracilis]
MATKIPPEILLPILEEDAQKDSLRNNYPWPYHHVCQYWHDVLVSSPMEWTYIKLRPSSENSEQHERYDLARSLLQLERSKGCPLTAYISGVEHHHSNRSYLATPYVFQESYRWKYVTISDGAIEPSSLLCALSRSVHLETLLSPTCSYTGLFDVTQRLTLPNLRRLFMSPFRPANNILGSIHASLLETLEIDSQISITALEAFLRASVPDKLTTLTIDRLGLRDEEVPLMRSSPQMCSRLKQLDIWFEDSSRTPALRQIVRLLTWVPRTGFALSSLSYVYTISIGRAPQVHVLTSWRC